MSLPRDMHWAAPIIEWQQTLLYRISGHPVYRLHAAHMRLMRTSGLWVTEHCIDRFVERWRPYADRGEAHATLVEMLCDAKPLDYEVWWCQGGAQPWMTGPIRLVVHGKTVATILPLEPL